MKKDCEKGPKAPWPSGFVKPSLKMVSSPELHAEIAVRYQMCSGGGEQAHVPVQFKINAQRRV